MFTIHFGGKIPPIFGETPILKDSPIDPTTLGGHAMKGRLGELSGYDPLIRCARGLKLGMVIPPILGICRKLRSMVRINGLFHLLINGGILGVITH